MFAVPGWSVPSGALKRQTDSDTKLDDSISSQHDSKPKKRKRQGDVVTNGSIDKLYREYIETQHRAPSKGKLAKIKPETDEKRKIKGQSQQAKRNKGGLRYQDAMGPKEPDERANTHEQNLHKPGGISKKRKKNNESKHEDLLQGPKSASSMVSAAEPLPSAPSATEEKLTPLQQAMRQKLISSRFRHLNETLYTTPSAKAMELFTANPGLFDEYHAGFSRQVKESWPSNPVDYYIQTVRDRGSVATPKGGYKPSKSGSQVLPLPRRPSGRCTIVDLGCGDAQLARSLAQSSRRMNLKILSYDLHSPSPLVAKADISNLPVDDGSVDIAIFCLSLMGTNWVSFVEEAWRVLRSDGKGECWVSEVKSRFGKVTRKKSQIGAKRPLTKSEKKKLKKNSDSAGSEVGSDVDDVDIYAEDARQGNGDETDISAFVEIFRTRGFVLKPGSVDMANKMFVKMEFVKQGGPPTKGKHAATGAVASSGKKRFIEKPAKTDVGMTPEEEASVLKPCVYKSR